MASSLAYLIYLPILIGFWVGIVGLGKSRRDGPWKTMLVGMSLLTLGLIAAVVGVFAAFANYSNPSGLETMMYVLMAVAGMIGLGTLLFSVGFAMHGFKCRRIDGRIAELETILAVQEEELNRLQANPSA